MIARPRLDWRFAIVATLILTCLVTLASFGRPGAPPFSALHDAQTTTWLTWLVLSPAIIAAARRFPFGEGTPMRWLGRHFVIGVAFSVTSMLLAEIVRALMGAGVGGHDFAIGVPLVSALATELLLYALIAVSYQALAYHRVARGREEVAERLRADLAESRLANLEGKLHPHFLFNALNSIAALMREDPRQAETMLEQVSELLHATLQSNPMHQVSLDDALHLTEQYLAIERVRFQHRLRATVSGSSGHPGVRAT